jgi:iron complex transport system ATP-binding protein
MIKLDNISCGYNNTYVVNNICIEILNGQNICIVGPNGCGKSTLLKAIVGLVGFKGVISIDGKDVKLLKRKEIAKKIAFMSQITSVYFSYTVFETVMLGRYSKVSNSVFATHSKKDVDYVNNCIDAVNISHLKNRFITDLSGGELQRVFLAKVFAQDPEIILLDEPTNHLDLKYQIELVEYLKKWSKNSEKIVIAVLHDINLALLFADKLMLMSNGSKVAYDTKTSILQSDYFNEIYGINVKEYMKNSFYQWNIPI